MELPPEIIEFHSDDYSFQWFYLALAHWQLGDDAQARRCYDHALRLMEEETSKLGTEGTLRLRIRLAHDEAARRLDVDEEPASTRQAGSPPGNER
jgi:hypothetical protein